MWYVVNPTDNTMEQYRTLITAIKRMKQVGNVEVPQESFLAVLKVD